MLKRYFRKHLVALCASTVLTAASGTVVMGLLAFTNKLVANGIQNKFGTMEFAAAMLVALIILSIATQWLLARLGVAIVMDLRTDLAARFLAVDYEKLVSKRHAIFGALIQDISRIGPLVLFTPQLAYSALLVVLCSLYLIRVSPVLYLTFLAFMAIALAGSALVLGITKRSFDEMRGTDEEFFAHLRTISDGKRELTMSRPRARHFLEKVMAPTIARSGAIMTRVHLVMGLNTSWSTLVMNSAVFVVVFFGYSVFRQTTATVIQFALGSLFFMEPLNSIVQTLQSVAMGFASMRHLEEIGFQLDRDAVRQPAAVTGAGNTSTGWSVLETSDICFRYPAETSVESQRGVGPVSLSIHRGETLFIIGGNGSGKSTLLLMLCGLLAPQQGRITLDGRPIDFDIEGFREMFCGTFNEGFVFKHVLNAAGHPGHDDDLQRLLRTVSLEGQLQVKDGELSRINVSSGQRKRLALVHCLSEDRQIYFFDEWAAEQDPVFREFFYDTVLPELKLRGKTIIVISHDDRHFRCADRIIKLDNGTIDDPQKALSPAGATRAECWTAVVSKNAASPISKSLEIS